MNKVDIFLQILGEQIYDKDVRKRVVQEFSNHIIDYIDEYYPAETEAVLSEIGNPIEIGKNFNQLYARKISFVQLILLGILVVVIGFNIVFYLDIVGIILVSIFLLPTYKFLEKKPKPCVGTLKRWGTAFFISGIIGAIGSFIASHNIVNIHILKLNLLPIFYGAIINLILTLIDIIRYKRFNH